MTEIEGLKEAEKLAGPIQWHEFRLIRRLCWEESPLSSGEHRIEMVLASEEREPGCELSLIFEAVQDFRLSGFGGGASRIVGFEIASITSRQWERLNWEVRDFENDEIHFFCRSVRVASARLCQ